MKAVERQIQDTGQVGGSNEYPPVGNVTSKEKVLSVYPKARERCAGSSAWFIDDGRGRQLSGIFPGASRAWDDAASQLPSAPSPAGETAKKSLSEVLEELCPGVGRRNRPAWATPLPLEPALPEPMMTTDEDAVPEPVATEEVCGWHEVFCPQPKGHSGDCFTQPREVAASIAPAAVSETDNAFDTWWDEHKKTEYSSVEYLARCVWNAARAKPSAEGDGWTAGFNAGIDAVIAAENDWNYFPVDMQRIAKLKRVPAPPSGQGEVK